MKIYFRFHAAKQLRIGILTACILLIFSVVSFAEEATTESAHSILSPYDTHGILSVSDNLLVDEQQIPILLKGVSLSNPLWYPDYLSKETFLTLCDEWNIEALRISVFSDSYLSMDADHKASYLSALQQTLEEASKLGLYIILDWHTVDGYDFTSSFAAQSFFQDILAFSSTHSNILYEISNPSNSYTWEVLSSYSTDVIDFIRSYVPNAVILVGIPVWGQDLDPVIQQPLARDNLLYALHIHADTHKEEFRARIQEAALDGLPLIATEFDLYSPSSEVTELTEETTAVAEGDTWLSFLDEHNISYFIKGLTNDQGARSLISAHSTKVSDWSLEELTEFGIWYRSYLPDPAYGIEQARMSYTNNSGSSVWTLSNGLSVSANLIESWSDSANTYYQYDIQLSNTSTSAINTWRLRLNWSCEVNTWDYENCQIGGSGTSRLFVPMDYNTRIEPQSSIAFRFTIWSATKPELLNVSLE